MRIFLLTLTGSFAVGLCAWPLKAAETLPAAPAQDLGLPYTRTARAKSLALIQAGVAVFPGSRYGYYKGLKVRLDEAQLRRGEAALIDGKVLVPASFAAVLTCADIQPDRAPEYLADRWVYTLGLPSAKGRPVDILAAAKAAGLPVSQDVSGLTVIGIEGFDFTKLSQQQRESLVTLFDTPEKYADPDIAARNIPQLAAQGMMTDHVKVSPEQAAILNGPETEWKFTPASEFDLKGFNARLLGSKVPAPGIYPRVLFSPGDVPALAARIKSTRTGQKSLIEMDYLFHQSFWDASTSDGQIFQKLSSGNLAGLEWDVKPGTPLQDYPHIFKGQKPGIFNTHVAYIPECLTAMAFYCLLTGDDAHGRQAAAAIANYYKLREPLLDEWLSISDSEFGSSYTRADGSAVIPKGNGASTHWRNLHGVVAHMNLGLSLDFAGKWMTPEQKDLMRRVIAKATYGRRSYGEDAPVRFRDVNWVGWDLTHYLAVTAIEGLEGYDPEAAEAGAETVRAFCEWGIDDKGVVWESNGKTAGSFQFITLSMVARARRGENLFGHPHWRKLLSGQVEMTSPSGRVTVTSGTQYVPFSRQFLSPNFIRELKGFYPGEKLADYLLTVEGKAASASSQAPAMDATWDPASYAAEVRNQKRLRLPSPTYPGFVPGVLYDGDFQPATRAELHLPLDFDAPVQGVFSSYSGPEPDAAWINMIVRPNHYLGAGHHHADAGMFHFSAMGVDWFTQSSASQEYAGKYFNLVMVDGESEPSGIPGQTLGYNAAAKFLGVTASANGALAGADLSYAYSYRWLTQPPLVWSDDLQNLGWELEPSPEILRIFAGTARYKMRPWWSTSNYSNYIATSRAPFNPMRYVFRTACLVRGEQPYGLVVDDLEKGDKPHLYQWTAMLNEGVWQAEVPGLCPNQIALAFRPPDLGTAGKGPIKPSAGEPLLLVSALGMEGGADNPLFKTEMLASPKDKSGHSESYGCLTINHQGTVARYRVLLSPFRCGQPLPAVSYDAGKGMARVSGKGLDDTVTFELAPDQRTHISASRAGAKIF